MFQRLPPDTFHEILIVIPTVATPKVLVPAFQRLVATLDGLKVHVVLSVNPRDQEGADKAVDECVRIWRDYDPDGCHLTVYDHRKLAGFGGAINLGIKAALGMIINATTMRGSAADQGVFWGIPRLTVVYNDDLVATPGWLQGLLRALDSEVVFEWGELPTEEKDGTLHRPPRRMADYGKVGLVGPASNNAAGIQGINPVSLQEIESVGWDTFAANWKAANPCNVLTASFLSGFCLGITRECMEALSTFSGDAGENPGEFAWLFDERYTVAGYEDNDLCVRADLAGFRAIAAGDTFVGHLGHCTFDASFPDMARGMANRLVYYDNWRPWIQEQGRRMVAAYRVRFDVPVDLGYFRQSLRRIASLVDGVAVLLTANPAAVLDSQEYRTDPDASPESDSQLCRLCAAQPGNASAYLFRWVSQVLAKARDTRFRLETITGDVIVQTGGTWDAPMNEREDRNSLLALAEDIGADWMLSIDHDEVMEPRLTRYDFERLMLHPDPLVSTWDLAFVNHWENPRMYRVDRPWGDGGTWTGGMRGYRFFRVNKASPRRILAGGTKGLHCGNTPGADVMAKRVSGARFRHFGYMNSSDRYRKERRYNEVDPNPDPLLVGGTSYGHITQDEEMLLSAFDPENGIGLHLLLHEGESADDLGRMLDGLYGVLDRVVLVWTGAWKDKDKGWTRAMPPGMAMPDDWEPKAGDGVTRRGWPWDYREAWPPTGPSLPMAKMAAHFGCEWLHQPLEDNLGAARNAGLEALHGTPGMGWGLFLDPDEQLPANAPIILRRMAEARDAWGWMFRFQNLMPDNEWNRSESVRMSRLDPEKVMRLHGRIHETFGRAVRHLLDAGYGHVLRVCPFKVLNTGMAKDPETMQRKLDWYRDLLEQQLYEDPHDPGAWVSLGLSWANEGCMETAAECLSRGVLCADKEYLPFQEMGMHLLRQARHFFAEAVERMEGHSMRKPWQEVVAFIEKAGPPMKILGTVGMEGHRSWTDQEARKMLPPFGGTVSLTMEMVALPNPYQQIADELEAMPDSLRDKCEKALDTLSGPVRPVLDLPDQDE